MNFLRSNTYLFKCPIWKLHPNLRQDHLLLVETRDAKLSKSLYYVVDLIKTSSVALPIEEPIWWQVPQAYVGDTIICSVNEDPNIPKPNLLKAYDTRTSTLRWALKDHYLEAVYENILEVTTKDHKRKYLNYDGNEVYSDIAIPPKDSPLIKSCSPENTLYADFVAFLFKKGEATPCSKIEYLETEHFLILSYAYKAPSKLRYKILAFDELGEKKIDEYVFKDNIGVIDTCFFLFGKSVLFLDNDYCLKAYEIT